MPNREQFAHQLADAMVRLTTGMRTLRCPVPGCTLRIRYRAVTTEEAGRLAALADDHACHGSK
ncbi:hypothetical protein ACFV2C_14975 [[Kitasatospora] papulosa]|uniref:hypothetical protein n=1 Tax=[Kitasatospora] papulosa TaxID=1464011 RepID=UPI0036CCF119